jgi:putative RecB family exonuclease
MRLSPTRINTYLTCPRKYRYRYIDKIPTLLTAPLAFGRVLHQVILALHLRALDKDSTLDGTFALAEFDRLWKEIQDKENPFFPKGQVTPEGYAALACRILSEYVRVNDGKPTGLLMEYQFEFPVGEHAITGIVDRVEEDHDRLVLIDFKSGKSKPTPAALRDDLQLTLYAYAVERVFERPVDRIVYYHLRDQTPLQTERTQQDFDSLLYEIVPFVAKSVAAQRFVPKYGWWCRFCDFRELCEDEGRPPEMAVFPPE